MCIIVYKPKGISVDQRTLATCFTNNPDGAGFMFPCEGRLLIKKGYFEFEDFLAAWEKCRNLHGDDQPIVFHFRIATSGEVDKANCHPHRIAHDLGFAHNGVLSCVRVPKGSAVSDTVIYRNRYLDTLTGQSLHNAKLFGMIGTHIGAGNKFVFMNGAGKTVICNEKQGVWKDGLWFSNYSFLQCRIPPFSIFDDIWFCEYCEELLVTDKEKSENACRECLDSYESGPVECCGCYDALPSHAHRELGWCDVCGWDVYGRNWLDMLCNAAEAKECDRAFPGWF